MGKGFLYVLAFLLLLGGGLSHVDNPTVRGHDVYTFGDLIVGGNETRVYRNCVLIQNGNISVMENGTLLLDNCSLVLNQSRMYQYVLKVHDNGRLFVLNSSISSDYSFKQFYDGNSMVNFTNTVLEHATWTYASGQFLYMRNCSELGHLSVSTNATFDSCIGYNALLTSEDANVQINNSQIGTIYVKAKDSALNVSDLPENKCQPYRVDYFNTFNNLTVTGGAVANLTVFNSDFSFGFETYNSNMTISDCYIASLEAYGASNISIVNSMISTIHAGESVNLTLTNVCLSGYIIAYDKAAITSENSCIQRIEASGEVFCSLNSSIVNEVSAYFSSRIYAVDSTLSMLSANQESIFSLLNSTYTSASINDQAMMFVSWYLDVHVIDSAGQNVSYANVTVYLEGTIIQSKLTDANGLARLTLQGELINATGHYLVADYFVNASYMAYQNTMEVAMISNMHITLTLEGLIIPESPTNLILPLFIATTLIAAILYRKKQKPKLKNI